MSTKRRLLKAAVVTAAPRLLARVTGSRRRNDPLTRATNWATGLVGRRRRRTPVGRLALQGLGAAALAVPLGLWVGRKVRGEEETAGGQTEANR